MCHHIANQRQSLATVVAHERMLSTVATTHLLEHRNLSTPHDQDRTRCGADDVVRRRAKHQQIDGAAPVDTHHYEIRLFFGCTLQNTPIRSPFNDG